MPSLSTYCIDTTKSGYEAEPIMTREKIDTHGIKEKRNTKKLPIVYGAPIKGYNCCEHIGTTIIASVLEVTPSSLLKELFENWYWGIIVTVKRSNSFSDLRRLQYVLDIMEKLFRLKFEIHTDSEKIYKTMGACGITGYNITKDRYPIFLRLVFNAETYKYISSKTLIPYIRVFRAISKGIAPIANMLCNIEILCNKLNVKLSENALVNLVVSTMAYVESSSLLSEDRLTSQDDNRAQTLRMNPNSIVLMGSWEDRLEHLKHPYETGLSSVISASDLYYTIDIDKFLVKQESDNFFSECEAGLLRDVAVEKMMKFKISSILSNLVQIQETEALETFIDNLMETIDLYALFGEIEEVSEYCNVKYDPYTKTVYSLADSIYSVVRTDSCFPTIDPNKIVRTNPLGMSVTITPSSFGLPKKKYSFSKIIKNG